MEFTGVRLKDEFELQEIVSLHYFEFAKDFVFAGERHPFWEFVYVDKGQAEVMAEDTAYTLKQGEIIFHKPDEFHSVWANRKIAPNLIVLTFCCRSEPMKFFENKIFSLGDKERGLLLCLLKEGMSAFLPPFDRPDINTLRQSGDAAFGSEQLIKTYLQQLLIHIRREHTHANFRERLSIPARERTEADVVRLVEEFLENNLYKNVTLNELCGYMNLSKTHLTSLCKQQMGTGVIERFRRMKISRAKTLIREGNHNITEISELLGYSNVHNFSRHFKQVTGVSPLHYARTIKIRLED